MRLRKDRAPSRQELQAFCLGQLDPVRAAEVESFLAEHPECGDLFGSVPDDEFVSHLRGARDLLGGETAGSNGTLPLLTDEAAGGSVSEDLPPVVAPEALANHPRYRLLRKLGEGGMGTVFLAEHRFMRRHVALKVIRPALLAHPLAIERFRREVRAAAQLSHPNIVAAYDAEEAGGNHFLVMEYVEGVTLEAWLATAGPPSVVEACCYVQQAAVGLQYAHEKGLVHRDLKPHNLMRTVRGEIKILDFGLARLACEQENLFLEMQTAWGTVLGTADYMAPEQASDSRTADIRADVYSLGCTLYHLLLGRPPFPEGTSVDKIIQHATSRPEALGERCPGLPVGLVQVVERMMAREPAARYQTPAEVATALEPFTGHFPAAKTTTTRRRRVLAAVVMGLLLLGTLAAGAFVYRIQTDQGELVITTEAEDVEVAVKQGGRVIRIVNTGTDKNVPLRSGAYELELRSGEGLKLETERFTLTRGGREVVRVERLPKKLTAPPPEKSPPPWDIAELPSRSGRFRRFPPVDNGMGYAPLLSPDGRLLALAVDHQPTDGAYRRVEETATGRLVRQVGYANEGITDLAFTSDGRQLLLCSKSKLRGTFVFRLWDLQTDQVRTLDIESPSGWPHAFDLSADDRRLALSIFPGQLTRVVEVADGKLLLEVTAPQDHPDARLYTRLSPDGRWAVTWMVWGDLPTRPNSVGRLRLDDLSREHPPQTVDIGHSIYQPFFTLDGRQVGVALRGKDEPVILDFWEVPSFRHARRLTLRPEKGAFADSVALQASAGSVRPWLRVWYKDRSLGLFDPSSGVAVHRIDPVEKARYTELSSDGRVLLFWDKADFQLYRLPKK